MPLNPSTTTVYARSAFYPSLRFALSIVCSLHFTLSLHFTPGAQSAVSSPQSAFYTDRLPKYLMQELELIQKRAMSIICPGVNYHEAFVIMNFKELATHHDKTFESLFHTIVNDNNHRLYKLLRAQHESILIH